MATISPHEPIDIVAHSHGANVVTAAMNQIPPSVNLGRLVFLGAPHCRLAASEEFLYPWDPGRLSRGAWPAPPALNVFSDQDTVQKGLSDAMVLGDPMYGAMGTKLCPLFDAFRVDPDPRTAPAYENVEVRTRSLTGWAAHGELHSPQIGAALGCWLACWPQRSGAECLTQCGVELDLPDDPPDGIRQGDSHPLRSSAAAATPPAGDIGEERAKQIAAAYFANLNPWSKRTHLQTVNRQGAHYVVQLMPENEMGILLYFVSFKVWVHAATGEVEKMV